MRLPGGQRGRGPGTPPRLGCTDRRGRRPGVPSACPGEAGGWGYTPAGVEVLFLPRPASSSPLEALRFALYVPGWVQGPGPGWGPRVAGPPLSPRTARHPRRGLWEAAAARPPGSSQRLGVGLPVSRPLGLARNVRRQRRWVGESRLQLWLHRIFFFFFNSPRWRTAIDFSSPMEIHRYTVIPNYAT